MKNCCSLIEPVAHGVHNGVHTRARIGTSGPNETHCIRVKSGESEQGERWGIGFLIRGSGVRVPPPLPFQRLMGDKKEQEHRIPIRGSDVRFSPPLPCFQYVGGNIQFDKYNFVQVHNFPWLNSTPALDGLLRASPGSPPG